MTAELKAARAAIRDTLEQLGDQIDQVEALASSSSPSSSWAPLETAHSDVVQGLVVDREGNHFRAILVRERSTAPWSIELVVDVDPFGRLVVSRLKHGLRPIAWAPLVPLTLPPPDGGR